MRDIRYMASELRAVVWRRGGGRALLRASESEWCRDEDRVMRGLGYLCFTLTLPLSDPVGVVPLKQIRSFGIQVLANGCSR